ncbi:hypothetical protein [Diaphorobacter caeni]|uniref:hypothetical protein n=1 Tax=Diaphorobacter caeni TaxID=2784387 RepID=UPI00188F6A38|nr:hypothetical protein [Diaphorobacter caeni]MBF5004858.1 hypothetical protein [Diaphorobacter caeni]
MINSINFPTRSLITRRLAMQALIGVASSTAGGMSLAKEIRKNPVNPLLDLLTQRASDSVTVVQLWPQLTENFSRSALLARCDAYRRPLSEMEWDMKFQSLIATDARNVLQIPVFKQFFWEPWSRQITKEWNALSGAKKQLWTDWLKKPTAFEVVQSLRAQVVFEACELPNWNLDTRTGTKLATPIVLVAQAFNDLGVRPLVDQAVAQTDKSLAKLWSRVRPLAETRREDAAWLLEIPLAFAENSDILVEHFDALALKKLPDRELWLDGPFRDIPGQCGYTLQGAESKAFTDAAFKLKLQDTVPATFAAYCGKS